MDGPTFKATLRTLGITQRWLAEELGLARSTVSDWAREKESTPVPQYAVAYLGLLAQIRNPPQTRAERPKRARARQE